jgi:membrane-associated protease RseP (regulator of RpoE activity)
MSMSLPTGVGPDALGETFHVYEVEVAGEDVRYYGEPLVSTENVVQRVAPQFRERGYRVNLNYETGEYVLVATERSVGVDGVPWTNVALFLGTVLTTLFAGAQWYGIRPLEEPTRMVEAWPFTVAVLGVLAVHEFGHYALSRYHDVAASLPYFIPLPNLLGTLGAVISMNDHIPDRDALFDIGVAGPLAGLVATVVVAAVGVSLPPVGAGGGGAADQVALGYPLLIQGVAMALGQPLSYGAGLTVNPVVVGGWVGAFVTFLNLLPVGQLDGAHITKALLGDRVGLVQQAVPVALFSLAGYLYLFEGGRSAGVWALWGFLTLLLSRAGNAQPLEDSPVGMGRKLVGLLTLVLGLLCFTPMPVVLTV